MVVEGRGEGEKREMGGEQTGNRVVVIDVQLGLVVVGGVEGREEKQADRYLVVVADVRSGLAVVCNGVEERGNGVRPVTVVSLLNVQSGCTMKDDVRPVLVQSGSLFLCLGWGLGGGREEIKPVILLSLLDVQFKFAERVGSSSSSSIP